MVIRRLFRAQSERCADARPSTTLRSMPAETPRDVVVFSSIWLPEAHLIATVLTREGIPASVRNQMRAGVIGELPIDDARIEVTVPASFVEQAEALIVASRTVEGVERPCPSCGEENPPSFEVCWSCAADLPPAPRVRLVE